MPKRKKPVEIDEDAPSDLIEEYTHGSLFNGDTPPDWVARAIADALRDNPYADVPTDELRALARDLRKAVEQLSLVERVLCARNSAW
jgi:hypothetical protein